MSYIQGLEDAKKVVSGYIKLRGEDQAVKNVLDLILINLDALEREELDSMEENLADEQ